MTEIIDIDYTTVSGTSVLYSEDVFIQITENMAEGAKYRVNARRQQYTADHKLLYIFPHIILRDTIEECKEFIFNYINDPVSQAIFDVQHRNALEACK